ncbi:MAG: hypothetical protein H6752_21740 [Candidatus Omnitrophica bacterium]|nr:hypothetical protein [Candidatus Omnitrophota bacterium]
MQPPAYTPPTPDELKKFGFTVGGIFFFLGSVFLIFFLFVNQKHPIKAAIFLSIGCFLILMSAVPPLRTSGLMFAIHKGWLKLAAFLARYVGHYVGMAIFGILFFLVFFPFGFVARLFGFDPLGVRRYRQAESYWHPRERALTSDHYERQFPMETPHDEP